MHITVLTLLALCSAVSFLHSAVMTVNRRSQMDCLWHLKSKLHIIDIFLCKWIKTVAIEIDISVLF